jgi:hypothetical protein
VSGLKRISFSKGYCERNEMSAPDDGGNQTSSE